MDEKVFKNALIPLIVVFAFLVTRCFVDGLPVLADPGPVKGWWLALDALALFSFGKVLQAMAKIKGPSASICFALFVLSGFVFVGLLGLAVWHYFHFGTF